MSMRAASRSVALAGVLAAVLAVSACSGTKSVAKAEVEDQSRAQLTATVGEQVPPVVCPGDLVASVGTVMVCSITSAETGQTYDVTLTVTSVDSSTGSAEWDIKVADTPKQ